MMLFWNWTNMPNRDVMSDAALMWHLAFPHSDACAAGTFRFKWGNLTKKGFILFINPEIGGLLIMADFLAGNVRFILM